MFITAYTAILEPYMGKLPIDQSIQSLYDHVDAFVIYDCSRYDKFDWRKYGKIKKYIKGLFNPFDDPFGSMFTAAYRLVESDHALFLDSDEIFEFKTANLKDIAKNYDLSMGGLAFPLRNYYCSRNFLFDGCSTKGCHVFKTNPNYIHDLIPGMWETDGFKRYNKEPDTNDGVRLVDKSNGHPIGHYPVISEEDVIIHHTSHLDIFGKFVRSLVQFSHVGCIDLEGFYNYENLPAPELVEEIYEFAQRQIDNKEVEIALKAIPHNYKSFSLLDDYIEKANVVEFDPTEMSAYNK